MISMKEIGKICGISESTVSKALSGYAGIKPATRDRVQEVARKYGYQPNAMVKCMQTGVSQSIGIACNHFQDLFSGAIMDGIQEVLHQAHYDSYVISWDKLVDSGENLLTRFTRRRVDGLLLLPMAQVPSASYTTQLYSFPNPVVLVDQFWGSREFDYVGSNNREAMKELVETLILLGYRKIGAVFYSKVSSGEERRAGFLDAMIAHGLPVNADSLCEVEHCDGDMLSNEVLRLLKSKDRPEVLVCFNDNLAVNVMNAARDIGLRIPEDLAVTGFGNLPFADMMRPRLTTVDQQAEEIGRQAARLLLDRICGRGEIKRREILIPARTILRQSSASNQTK